MFWYYLRVRKRAENGENERARDIDGNSTRANCIIVSI